jgi:hypothetical protein
MRNLTKESRLKSRESQFTYLVNNGYIRETYKGLDFFTKDEGKYFALKIFRGTAANHELYMHYHTAERRAAVIQQYKDGHERREAWKAEQKEKNKGKSSSHAAAAATIRKELKAAFPSVKFSVTSDSFSGGDSVDVRWTDGPTTGQVEKFSSKYQYGHFNGMDDIYEYTNSREDIPQAKYVQEHRSMSDEAEKIVYDALLNQYGKGYFENLDQWEIKRRIYQKFAETDFCPTIEPTPEKPTTTPDPEAGDKIQIVDYSEKAFAVIGNFSAHYDNLIKLGGAYNSRLKCGRGIIFSKKKLEEVKEYLIAAKGENKEPKQQQPEETQPEEEKPFILHTSPNFETPQTNVFQLEYFKIIWHEGRHIPGATFENTVFNTWEDVQTAFLNLWEVNEKGADGGYTKVKCEMKFTDQEIIINRIDITNRIKNGDFNPSQEHIVAYLQSIAEETEEPQPIEQPQKHKSLPEIRQAATAGKVISLYNLYELVNQ